MIGGQAQPVRPNLNGRVAVSQMIGRAREQLGVFTPHFDQLLGSRPDAHDSSIVGAQAVAVAQYRPALEQQPDFLATPGDRAQATLLAQFEWKQQLGIERGLGTDALADKKHRRPRLEQ
jgi:hypothetical protein